MLYYSSRDRRETATPSEAVSRGLAPDGGLYLPECFPEFPMERLTSMTDTDIEAFILSAYFTDMDPNVLRDIAERAYLGAFEDGDIAPVVRAGHMYIAELWHGTTCAFKDVALSVLPHLMTEAVKNLGMKKEICLLTATSGDTGSAALAGFSDVPGTRIIVFYPHGGVSTVQRRQMTTVTGANTTVCALKGNFDDAQSAVKSVFLRDDIPENVSLSSANSINIGRLVPQIAYYFTSYRRLAVSGEIEEGSPVSFVVPTGNFGDILAGYFAMKMSLPVDRLICASNENNVLSDFFETGVYDRRRDLIKTASPSMDILISSNLERLISLVCGPEKNREYMRELSEKGIYSLDGEELKKIKETFTGTYCPHDEAADAIRHFFEDYGYLSDPHTAVALAAAGKETLSSPVIVLSTASAFKFAPEVLRSIGEEPCGDEAESMEKLSRISGQSVPERLAAALRAPEVHTDVIEREDIAGYVLGKLSPGNASVTVRVPATSANVGPGFDCLAAAFDLYNTFTVSVSDTGSLTGFEEGTVYEDCLFVRGFEEACRRNGKKAPKLSVALEASVPASRGLGSSATLLCAGAAAANRIMSLGMGRSGILSVASDLEGHADNACAAVYGGLCAVMKDEDGSLHARRLPLSDRFRFLALIPDYRTDTEKSRGILPTEYTREDSVYNLSHLVMTLSAFSSGDESLLAEALKDRIHQPYRLPLNEEADRVISLCRECGALSVYLSGSGPTLMAVYTSDDFTEKLLPLLSDLKCGWKAVQLRADDTGTTVS